jgi:hypothetical protein
MIANLDIENLEGIPEDAKTGIVAVLERVLVLLYLYLQRVSICHAWTDNTLGIVRHPLVAISQWVCISIDPFVLTVENSTSLKVLDAP